MSNKNSSDRSRGIFYKLVHLEPALWRMVIMAVIAVLTSLGILVSDDLANNLVLAVIAICMLIQAIWTRSDVIPEEKVVSYLPNPSDTSHIVSGPAEPSRYVSDEHIVTVARRS